MEYKAILNNYRMSPRKVRLVVDVVRKKAVDEAVLALEHLHKKSADPIRKLIQSAAANAKNLDAIPTTRLVVDRIYVDEGPTMRRFRPRAFGRAFMIRKRSSKVTVVLQAIDLPSKKLSKTSTKKEVSKEQESSSESKKSVVKQTKPAVSKKPSSTQPKTSKSKTTNVK